MSFSIMELAMYMLADVKGQEVKAVVVQGASVVL